MEMRRDDVNGEETRTDKVISWTICLWVYLAENKFFLSSFSPCVDVGQHVSHVYMIYVHVFV